MIIENQYLKLKFKTQGSEWTSFFDKQKNLEYAWQGDEQYWAGRNPTLFPIVGKLWQEKYLYQGKTYSLGNHGFARHSNFSLEDISENRLVMSLTANEATKQSYPFDFKLTNHYWLQDKTLQITQEVKNTGEVELPFSLGAHPAFNCPWRENDQFEDYKIIFAQKEKLKRLFLNSDSSFSRERINFGYMKELPLKRELFANDALVFENLQSDWIRLQGKKEGITLQFNQSPWFGIWTKPAAPFICLEPWQGHGDFTHYQGEFVAREGTIILPTKTSYEYYYQITID